MKLTWSRTSTGNWNGKMGWRTCYVVAFHVGDSWWVHSKMPGDKSAIVASVEEGIKVAGDMFRTFLREADGAT